MVIRVDEGGSGISERLDEFIANFFKEGNNLRVVHALFKDHALMNIDFLSSLSHLVERMSLWLVQTKYSIN